MINITFPVRNAWDANPNRTQTVEFPTSNNNETFETLLNVSTVPVDNQAEALVAGPVIQTVPVKLIGTSETTARGVRRVLLKAEIPYCAVKTDASGTVVKDTSRSGGAITCHMVVTVPKELAEDLSASGVNQMSAMSQVVLVKAMLDSLAITGAGNLASGANVLPVFQTEIDRNATWSIAMDPDGVVSPSYNGLAYASQFAKAALTRGLLGLKPLGSDNITVFGS